VTTDGEGKRSHTITSKEQRARRVDHLLSDVTAGRGMKNDTTKQGILVQTVAVMRATQKEESDKLSAVAADQRQMKSDVEWQANNFTKLYNSVALFIRNSGSGRSGDPVEVPELTPRMTAACAAASVSPVKYPLKQRLPLNTVEDIRHLHTELGRYSGSGSDSTKISIFKQYLSNQCADRATSVGAATVAAVGIIFSEELRQRICVRGTNNSVKEQYTKDGRGEKVRQALAELDKPNYIRKCMQGRYQAMLPV
jgi:hypothetical protein